MAEETRIEGLGDLRKAFGELAHDMETRSARLMVSSAGGVVKNKAKSIAQAKGLRKTGAMINNIVIKREKNVPDGVVQYHLGVRHGRQLGSKAKKVLAVKKSGRIGIKYVDDPFYWRFHEFERKVTPPDRGQEGGGVTTYFQRLRNGKVVKREKKWRASSIRARRRSATQVIPAKPFIQPALETSREEAIEAMKRRLALIIKRANKK